MINSINNVNFKSCKQDLKMLLPRKLVGYSKHTPKMKGYEELHFMPELKKKNSFIEMFKNLNNLKNKAVDKLSDFFLEVQILKNRFYKN